MTTTETAATVLGEMTQALAAKRLRIIDLSQTLTPGFPQIVLPPEFDQCAPFRMEVISHYDKRGPNVYWNNISFGGMVQADRALRSGRGPTTAAKRGSRGRRRHSRNA